jgi:hypothetical protein
MAHEPEFDTAALYALGLLSEEEAREFEQSLANGARDESLYAANQFAAGLAAAVEPVSPPRGLRERLMRRVAPPAKGSLGAVRASEGRWRKTEFPGVSFKILYYDKAAGLLTTLVRMEPGSQYPAHVHGRTEQCLVIEGDLRHQGHVYGPGDFTYAEAGTIDPELHTEGGNLLLIIGSPGTEFIRG